MLTNIRFYYTHWEAFYKDDMLPVVPRSLTIFGEGGRPAIRVKEW